MMYTPTRQKKRTRPRGWLRYSDLTASPKAEAVRADLLDRLNQHKREDTLPRGGRGLFYDLRPHGIPGDPRGVLYTKDPKTRMDASPQYVTDILAEMRRVYDPETDEWLIPEDWIADARSPEPIKPLEVNNADEGAQGLVDYLSVLWLARQAGQPVYLELRCEAQDLMPRIARIAEPYGVAVYSGSGMDGLKTKKEAAQRAAGRDVLTLIGILTDYDRAGGDIGDAFTEDVQAFVRWHQEYEGAIGTVEVHKLALTQAQAAAHDLLDDEGKAELDGLPVPVLDAIVRDWIESQMDLSILEEVKSAEPHMRREAAQIALRLLGETYDTQI